MQNRKAGIVIAVELENRTVRFFLGNMLFEFDKEKNRKNIEKHGVSFTTYLWSILNARQFPSRENPLKLQG